MGYTFQASQYMNGYHFYIKSISMGYLFHPKSIWMGKIWKIVYEWGQFSKIVYEWGQFSIWEVYEWVMFFTWPGIRMGWGFGDSSRTSVPKIMASYPPPRGYSNVATRIRWKYNWHEKSYPGKRMPSRTIIWKKVERIYTEDKETSCFPRSGYQSNGWRQSVSVAPNTLMRGVTCGLMGWCCGRSSVWVRFTLH